MNWEAIGVTAELLGAIGVIATLVYLARQINQNTSTVRASAAAALSETNTGLSALLAQDARSIGCGGRAFGTAKAFPRQNNFGPMP